jgi:leucyl/phenylalanyl-tRNA--protein transferase
LNANDLKAHAHTFDPDRPSPRMLLLAYQHGIFPMADPDTGRLEWFSPDPRGVIPLASFHVPRSLGRVVRSGRFEIRIDTAFERVIRACAGARTSENRTWISPHLIRAYIGLHEMGHAHSVEAWLGGSLVGGLYGVSIAGAFFGESMFSAAGAGGSNASKVCLVHLVERLKSRGFTLLDTQFWNEHLSQFGCIEVPRERYLAMLAAAIDEAEEKW